MKRRFFHLRGRLCDSRKIYNLTREFHVKFHLKNRYHTHRFAIRAISVFRVKLNAESPRQVMNFPIVSHTIPGKIKLKRPLLFVNMHWLYSRDI